MFKLPPLSHHCLNVPMSVLAFAPPDMNLPHLLAIGSNVGSLDIVNLHSRELVKCYEDLHPSNIKDIFFANSHTIVSCGEQKLVSTDINLFEIHYLYVDQDPIQCASFAENVFLSTSAGLLSIDLRSQSSTKASDFIFTEISVLSNNIFAVKDESLYYSDIRNPNFMKINLSMNIAKLNQNYEYLVLTTVDNILYSFPHPLMPDFCKKHTHFDSRSPIRPNFYRNSVYIYDSDAFLFFYDLSSDNSEIISIKTSQKIISSSANNSAIAVSLEDEIFVYSQFEYEDNLIRIEEFEEEEDQSDWLKQTLDVKEGECTYETHGYVDQSIFVCYTCRTNENPFGVCQECAKICHHGHDVHPIGNRRRFRCDCGNRKMGKHCSAMVDPKVVENTLNTYGHNFSERWCFCDGPDCRTSPMIQCLCCSDWFHYNCSGLENENVCLLVSLCPELDSWIFICRTCEAKRLTYLQNIPNGEVPWFVQEILQISTEETGLGFKLSGGRWISETAFHSFSSSFEEYQKEFGKIDPSIDAELPRVQGQKQYADEMRAFYTQLFQRVHQDGRTHVQSSDVRSVFQERLSNRLYQTQTNNQFQNE